MNGSQKHIYVVIGMARSGTSAITRGLKALGIDLGDNLAPAEAQFNPKGVYEDLDVAYNINRAICYTLGFNWESLQWIDPLCRNNPKLNNLKEEAQHILQQRFTHRDHWAFKDPRTSKLLSFWQSVFKAEDLKEHYVIAIRHPLASAYSWHRLNEVDVEEALLCWLIYTFSAVEGTHQKNRVFVSYDLMLQNPLTQLERIKSILNIQKESHPSELEAYANQFLDKSLRHHDFNDSAKESPILAIAPICLKMYDLLMQVARDEMLCDSDRFQAAWQEIKSEFETVYPIYCYIDKLIKKCKDQERQLRTIKKSFPYKLIFPLRLVDNFLRGIRNKRKNKHRLAAAG